MPVVTAPARPNRRLPMPRGPSADRGCCPSSPEFCDKPVTTSTFVSFPTARQGVAFQARTADRDAREPLPPWSGRVCHLRRSPQPRPVPLTGSRQLADHTKSRLARDPRRVAALERGSPCQPAAAAPPLASPPRSCWSCWSAGAPARRPRRPPRPRRARPPARWADHQHRLALALDRGGLAHGGHQGAQEDR